MLELYGEHSAAYTFRGIRDIDHEGLWVLANDRDGNEVELQIMGLTRGTLADWLKKYRHEE